MYFSVMVFSFAGRVQTEPMEKRAEPALSFLPRKRMDPSTALHEMGGTGAASRQTQFYLLRLVRGSSDNGSALILRSVRSHRGRVATFGD